jgi:ketosteroid isomerase-like protein
MSSDTVHTDWEHDVDELEARFTRAIANKDLDGFMSCIWNSPDVIFLLGGGRVVRGYDNVRGDVKQMMDAHESLKLEVLEESKFRRGDFVFVVGTAQWTMVPTGGSLQSFMERWTDVRMLEDDKWVVVINHITILEPESE